MAVRGRYSDFSQKNDRSSGHCILALLALVDMRHSRPFSDEDVGHLPEGVYVLYYYLPVFDVYEASVSELVHGVRDGDAVEAEAVGDLLVGEDYAYPALVLAVLGVV